MFLFLILFIRYFKANIYKKKNSLTYFLDNNGHVLCCYRLHVYTLYSCNLQDKLVKSFHGNSKDVLYYITQQRKQKPLRSRYKDHFEKRIIVEMEYLS